ncbi:MAG: hypothetical protein ABIQ65_15775 [Thermoanaerobaculia bacterium]
MSVPCLYPSQDDYEYLPEEYEGWKTTDTCNHAHCVDGDYYARLYAHQPKPLTREDREEIEADIQLMRDEYHGRDLDGRVVR